MIMSNRKQRLRRQHEAQQNKPKQEDRVYMWVKLKKDEILAILDSSWEIMVSREKKLHKMQKLRSDDVDNWYSLVIMNKTNLAVIKVLIWRN